MGLFSYSENDLFTFFVVLVRFSVVLAILPFFGDKIVPAPLKILFSLILTIVLYPVIKASGFVNPNDARNWTQTAASMGYVIGSEVVFGLALGFMGRLIFDCVQIGGDLIGMFMGLSSANTYDPHQESNTQLIGRFKVGLATLLFVTMNAHHAFVVSLSESYRFVGMGKVNLGGAFVERMLSVTGELIRLGLQLAAPMAIALFSINIVYGVISKALPQLNILVLSFSVSIMIGLFVLWISLPEFSAVMADYFSKTGDYMAFNMSSMGQ